MNGAEVAGVITGSVGAFFGILAWLSALQWFKKHVGTMYRSLMWRCRGDAWFATRIERASISDYELLLYDVRRLRKIPKVSIKTVVDKCWQSFNIDVGPPTPLWELLLEAARFHPYATFDSIVLRFRTRCTYTAVQYFHSFLDRLHTNNTFNLKNFPPESLRNFISIIEAQKMKFSYDRIFGALELLGFDSPDEAWSTIASMADHVDESTSVADMSTRLDRFHVFICKHYNKWERDSKFYALKTMGTLSRITGKRYKLPARIKDDLDTCTVDFGGIQQRMGNSYAVSTMFTFE